MSVSVVDKTDVRRGWQIQIPPAVQLSIDALPARLIATLNQYLLGLQRGDVGYPSAGGIVQGSGTSFSGSIWLDETTALDVSGFGDVLTLEKVITR